MLNIQFSLRAASPGAPLILREEGRTWRDVPPLMLMCWMCESLNIVTNVSGCPGRDLSHDSGQILSCDGMTENYDWHYRGYLESPGTRADTLPPRTSPVPVSHHIGSFSEVTKCGDMEPLSHRGASLKEIEVNSIEIVMGSEQDPGSSKKYWLTRWHMIDRDICSVTSVANSFRAVQLNCDTDKSCLNKQYLWLRRLWAIVAVTPVTKKIKPNEWILEFWTFWSQLKWHFLEINNKN